MVPEMDGSTKFLHQLQQDKIKEELLKANKELNQQLEVQRAKVRASKDTIKRLLIRQSRMERKQVSSFYHSIWSSSHSFLMAVRSGQGEVHGEHSSSRAIQTDSARRTLQGRMGTYTVVVGHVGDRT